MWAYFFKRASDWIQGARYYWKAYLIIWTTRSSHSEVLKNLFLNGGELSEIHFLGFVKIFRTSIFLSTTEGLLLNIPETRSSLLWIFIFSISHFSSLETMYRSSRLQLFFKMGVLKNFAIFTGKHLCWSLFLIKYPAFRATTLLKGGFPANIAKFLRTTFYIESLRWLLLNVLEKGCLLLCIHKLCWKF